MPQLIRATSGLHGQPESIEIAYRPKGENFNLSRTIVNTTFSTSLTLAQAVFLRHHISRFLESQKGKPNPGEPDIDTGLPSGAASASSPDGETMGSQARMSTPVASFPG